MKVVYLYTCLTFFKPQSFCRDQNVLLSELTGQGATLGSVYVKSPPKNVFNV